MESESLTGITGDITGLVHELHEVGGRVVFMDWVEVPESAIIAVELPADPEKAARCRQLIQRRREQLS
jgi:hypothetical protein